MPQIASIHRGRLTHTQRDPAYSASFLIGSHVSDLVNGMIVLAMVAIAGLGGLKRSNPPTTSEEERIAFSRQLGNRLFLPALIVPVTVSSVSRTAPIAVSTRLLISPQIVSAVSRIVPQTVSQAPEIVPSAYSSTAEGGRS